MALVSQQADQPPERFSEIGIDEALDLDGHGKVAATATRRRGRGTAWHHHWPDYPEDSLSQEVQLGHVLTRVIDRPPVVGRHSLVRDTTL